MPKKTHHRRARRGDVVSAGKFNHTARQTRRVRVGSGMRMSQHVDGLILNAAQVPRGVRNVIGMRWLGTVEVLPAIPVGLPAECYWTSVGAGTGDDQIWRAHPGQTSWTPTQKTTIKSGTPV